MAAVSRSSPGKGAPRCSPLGNRAKPTPSPDTARKASRSLVFQPQLLDSTSQDDRTRQELEPNAKKSLIPSPSKQKREPPSVAKSDSDAEPKDTASSTMSAASIADVDGSPKSVLDAEAALAMCSSFNQHELPHSAIIKQADKGSESSSIIVMVLNSDNEALLMSTIAGKDGSVDLKALISSSAFLEAGRPGAKSAQSDSRQPSRRNVFAFAALVTTILSYTLIGISMIQQQRFASWDYLIPA